MERSLPNGYTKTILERLARHACEILEVERACIFVSDEDTGAPVAVAGHGVPRDLIGRRLRRDQCMVGEVLETGRPVLLSEYTRRGRPIEQTVTGGVRAAGAAPISWGGEVRGAISAGTVDTQRRFGRHELDALADLAELGGMALEHAEMRDRLEQVVQAGVEVLAKAVDMRDSYTARHSDELASLARRVGERLELPARELLELEFAARLHDLGKIGVPDQILRKPGPLTEQEWDVVRHHPAWGAEMLASIPGLERVASLVMSHHERYDGQGYPDGLSGDEIPLGSRIISTCDAYQAMVSNRPYRPALAPVHALRELREQAGTQFDPDAVDALSETTRDLAVAK
jgi:response regulator RpfG family c-di-GMP phosphodiesterase